jgi:ferric-dicitrate binding protein FerR (iron transport regulator)
MSEQGLDKERISKYFNGELPDEDSSYVERIINDGGYDRELKKLMNEQFSGISEEDDYADNESLGRILHTINYNIASERSSKRSSVSNRLIRFLSRTAAVLFLPLLVYAGWSIFHDSGSGNMTWIEIKAPAWTRAQFELPDGTRGWLNSKSSVRYNGDFTSKRNVELTGEAFFDVTKDPEHPFLVKTDDISLEVLGTRFNVASYSDERNIEVVLEEGSLKFINAGMNQMQLMKPNDLIVYDKKLKSIASEVVQPKKYLSWTEGTLVFRNDPIDVVARRLARWYNADVVLKNDIDYNLRLRATFVDESLEEVLKLLKLSLPIEYTLQNASIQSDSTYSHKKIIISSAHTKRN